MQAIIEIYQYLRADYAHEIVRSFMLIISLLIIRMVVDRLLARNERADMDTKRRWSAYTRQMLALIGLGGIGMIWASELQSLAVSMLAFAVALILATKELIMCLTGGLLRQMSNSYSLGDHIEVGSTRGRVVDIGMLSTTVMEIGPAHNAHQITGRGISFPHSLLLSVPVIKEDYMGEYVLHIINIPLPYSTPPARAERLLMEVAQTHCEPHIDSARQHMDAVAKRYLLDIPSVEPRLSMQAIDDKRYQMILRIAIPARERQRIEQAIMQAFLTRCFPEVDE